MPATNGLGGRTPWICGYLGVGFLAINIIKSKIERK